MRPLVFWTIWDNVSLLIPSWVPAVCVQKAVPEFGKNAKAVEDSSPPPPSCSFTSPRLWIKNTQGWPGTLPFCSCPLWQVCDVCHFVAVLIFPIFFPVYFCHYLLCSFYVKSSWDAFSLLCENSALSVPLHHLRIFSWRWVFWKLFLHQKWSLSPSVPKFYFCTSFELSEFWNAHHPSLTDILLWRRISL